MPAKRKVVVFSADASRLSGADVAPDVLYTRSAIVHDEKPGATVAPFNETVFTVHAVVVGETRTAEKLVKPTVPLAARVEVGVSTLLV